MRRPSLLLHLHVCKRELLTMFMGMAIVCLSSCSDREDPEQRDTRPEQNASAVVSEADDHKTESPDTPAQTDYK